MTASTPRKEPGGQPQRIFINAGKIVERPPTLFRMPTVKKQVAVEIAAAASPPVEPPESRQTHTFPSADTPIFAPHIHTATPSEAPVAPPAPQSKPANDARSEKMAKFNSAAASLPMPARRTWMETIGSRLVLLLLIAAVAAVAFLANRGGGGPTNPDATFVGMELEASGEDAAATKANQSGAPRSGGAAAAAKPRTLAQGSTGARASAPPEKRSSSTQSLATHSRGNDSPSAKAAAAKATIPRFDLAELHGERPQTPRSSAATSVAANTSGGNQRNSAASSTEHDAAQIALRPTRSDEETEQRTAAREDSAARDDSAAGARATSGAIAMDDRWVAEPGTTRSPSTGSDSIAPEGISAEDAILAAVEAAVASPDAVASGAGVDYATTNQPAGVPDWSQYLPPDDGTPPSLDARSAFGRHAPPRPHAPGGAGPPGYPAADGPPYGGQGGADPSAAIGADAPSARTAMNPYAPTASPRWDGGYATAPGSASAVPAGTTPQDSFSGWNPQLGEPSSYGSRHYGNPPHGTDPSEIAQPPNAAAFDTNFPPTR